MAEYLLILHDSTTAFRDFSPEQMQSILGEYQAWATRLVESGAHRGGQKLKDEGGRHLTHDKGELRVIDGPYSETKEVIGGFFLIEAESYDQAVEYCQESPHLKYDGRIEIREIDVIE